MTILTAPANDLGANRAMQTDFGEDLKPGQEELTYAKSMEKTKGVGMKENVDQLESSPIDIPGLKAKRSMIPGAEDDSLLRNGCFGQPPKPPFQPFFNFDLDSRTRSPKFRHATVAGKPDLNSKLAATTILYNGHQHLPLTLKNIRRLSVLWKGSTPVADVGLFIRLIVNEDINSTHADHVLDALEFVGHYCEHLVFAGPIKVSEFKDVFYREELDIGTGDDWARMMEKFPNVQSISYEHHLKI
ncbi:uncharacterized protein N0V89_010951 [Didymosphaeria variabile]|uniref:Uncharacterized protein n=1 Tax=Didymosphaeria variabile TaxID=1932322 RepID=A0A9W9C7L9_9PLEO|nr:uncharacterized protein N0V89_010951 [Didymosphaeria variabile]KAJ4347017.1 hypothetical protein N0V89_010951 [Didymosphaeria variabile]